MTLGSLFGPLGPANIKTSLAHDRGDYYYSPPWKSYSHSHDHKGYKSALSAITLLAFLFFLHVLQNCLRDQMMNQTPLIIMMTTTTTTTTTSQKRHRRDEHFLLSDQAFNEGKMNNKSRSQTDLVPYYDFLTDISDGSALNQSEEFSKTLIQIEHEFFPLFEVGKEWNNKNETGAILSVYMSKNSINKPNMHLNDFWLEEEKQLTCCKHLICEMKLFLGNKTYSSYISHTIGLSCGLNKEDAIGVGSCSEVKKICQEENGKNYFENAIKKSFINLISYMKEIN